MDPLPGYPTEIWQKVFSTMSGEDLEPISLFKNKPHWVILALCLKCQHRWVGTIMAGTKLNSLECPDCGTQDSFASFLPPDYTEEFL